MMRQQSHIGGGLVGSRHGGCGRRKSYGLESPEQPVNGEFVKRSVRDYGLVQPPVFRGPFDAGEDYPPRRQGKQSANIRLSAEAWQRPSVIAARTSLATGTAQAVYYG